MAVKLFEVEGTQKAVFAGYGAVLIGADGSLTHLAPRELLSEAQRDADEKGADVDAQVLAMRPRRVVAAREAHGDWWRC